jgi:hypothetical protein
MRRRAWGRQRGLNRMTMQHQILSQRRCQEERTLASEIPFVWLGIAQRFPTNAHASSCVDFVFPRSHFERTCELSKVPRCFPASTPFGGAMERLNQWMSCMKK